MPEIRINSLKSRAMNCGPLSETIHGFASGYFSLARSRITSMSASFTDSRTSQRAFTLLLRPATGQFEKRGARGDRTHLWW
jgi:hypothetical protein